tara:strand:+ start:20049 stop:20405 length:357 start_codon:yes stop_codon:yes gene_type:complete
MATKDQVVDLIKGWLKNDKELKLLQNEVKMRRIKKKEISTQLVNIMKDNEIDSFDISEGKIIHTQKKTKSALSKKHILNALTSYFAENPEVEVEEISNYIMGARDTKIVDDIRHKEQK